MTGHANKASVGSLAEQLRENGVSRSAYYARVRRGWSKDRARSEPASAVNRSSSVDQDQGIGERLKAAGVSRVTYYARLRRGWSKDQALASPSDTARGRPARLVMPDGEAAVRAARRNGVARRTFYRRVERGGAVGRAAKPAEGKGA